MLTTYIIGVFVTAAVVGICKDNLEKQGRDVNFYVIAALSLTWPIQLTSVVAHVIYKMCGGK